VLGEQRLGLRGQDTNCRISRPAVDARLSRSEPPRPSTSLSAEAARRRRRGGRLPRWRTRRRARPEAPPENRRDNFALIALTVVKE
jgi:hypothetical protein